jgi:uncharacterized protein YuzE
VKVHYDPQTDSATILFNEHAVADGNECISENVFAMYDKDNAIIGIEIMGNAQKLLSMKSLEFVGVNPEQILTH